MKTVLDKSTVAHYWANQIQQTGRVAGGNFYFKGRTIYSYGPHFPIAIISKKDSHAILFTTCTYSNTTAKHIMNARMAISHKRIIYCKNPKAADENEHEENINNFEDDARRIAIYYLPKSKKPEIYLNQIAEQKAMLMAYVDFFGLKPSAYKHLHYINIVTKDGAILASEKTRKENERAAIKREKERAKRKAEVLAKEQERLSLWRKFKLSGYSTISPTLYLYELENTFLRYDKSKKEIQTTKGVVIPENVAKRFYSWLKRMAANGGCSGDCKHKILDYEVSSVTNTNVVIGCHNITWDEINAMAKKLKW